VVVPLLALLASLVIVLCTVKKFFFLVIGIASNLNVCYFFPDMNEEKRQRLSLSKKLAPRSFGDISSSSHSIIAEPSKKQQSLLSFTSASVQKLCHSSDKEETHTCSEVDENVENSKQDLLKRKNTMGKDPVKVNSIGTVSGFSGTEEDLQVKIAVPVKVPVCIESSEVMPSISHVRHMSVDLSEEDGTSSSVDRMVAEDSRDELNTPFVPYYLDSFLLVINTVLNDSFYSELFNEEDHVAVHAFRNLPG
jgi:hypothetical protein